MPSLKRKKSDDSQIRRRHVGSVSGGGQRFNPVMPGRKKPDAPSKQSQSRARKQARRALAFKVEAVIIIVLLLVVSVQSLRLSSNATARTQSKQFTEEYVLETETAVRSRAQDIIESSVSHRIKPYVPRDQLESLSAEFPQIKNIELSLNRSAPRPILNIEMQDIALVYRAAGINYFLTDDGRTIEASNEIVQGSGDLPLLNDVVSRARAIDDPSPVISSEAVSQIKRAHQIFVNEGQGGAIASYEINQNPNELIVRFTDRGYYIKLLLGDDFINQVGAAIVFINTANQEQSQVAIPTEYIDARLAERVVYR